MVVDVIFIWGIDSTVCVFVQCVLLFLQDAYAWIFTNCVLLRIYIFILLHDGIAMRHNRGHWGQMVCYNHISKY